MARSAKQIRRTAAAPEKKRGRFRLGPIFDGVVLIMAALVAALALGLSVSARQLVMTTLAYGWIPVAAWAVSVLLVLRYRCWWLLHYWRWWVGAAGLAAISIGVMSFFFPGVGLLSEVSLGGRWGGILGGTPLALGVLKLLAITLLTPLLIYPKWMGSYY